MDDFIREVHLSFTHIAGVHVEVEDKEPEATHPNLFKIHCAGKARKFIRSLPARKGATSTQLIASLRSAFRDVGKEEVRAYGAVLGLRQREGEDSARYSRRAQRIPEHVDPKHDQLLAIKFR